MLPYLVLSSIANCFGGVARIFLLARSIFCFSFGWHSLDRWQRLSHSTSSKASACDQFALGLNASVSGKSMKFFVDTADDQKSES